MIQDQENDLAALILMRKGDRSYDRLSKDCGGYPTANRLQQMATKQLSDFPTADSIRGLSQGLGAPITEVTLACARSLGLNVRGGEPDALTIAGAGALPPEAQEILFAMARQMMRMVDAEKAVAVRELEIVPLPAKKTTAKTVRPGSDLN